MNTEKIIVAFVDLQQLARALGGEVRGGQVVAPGPGHSPGDRSLAVRLSAQSPFGFVAHSHAGDDWRACRDHVLEKLGLPALDADCRAKRYPRTPQPDCGHEQRQHEKAAWLWSQRRLIAGTPAERYLREARGYAGPIPRSLAFLPPTKPEHHPAMIAAFGLVAEAAPGTLREPRGVDAVHLTLLRADGSAKADVKPSKLILGRPLARPIVLAPPNDLLGLAICEGIEDGLTAHAATGLGAWVAGAAGFMPALADLVPAHIDAVTIFAHPDKAGLRGAYALAAALGRRGFEVRVEGGRV
jgi:hypothetical protein